MTSSRFDVFKFNSSEFNVTTIVGPMSGLRSSSSRLNRSRFTVSMFNSGNVSSYSTTCELFNASIFDVACFN